MHGLGLSIDMLSMWFSKGVSIASNVQSNIWPCYLHRHFFSVNLRSIAIFARHVQLTNSTFRFRCFAVLSSLLTCSRSQMGLPSSFNNVPFRSRRGGDQSLYLGLPVITNVCFGNAFGMQIREYTCWLYRVGTVVGDGTTYGPYDSVPQARLVQNRLLVMELQALRKWNALPLTFFSSPSLNADILFFLKLVRK